jgi:heptaprenyl diphosphate synthase
MPKTKKLALMAILTAIALTIFMIEAQLPSIVPIPGVKLGLANIITLTTMLILGRKEAGAVLLMRIVLGAVFAGSPSAILYSAAGGMLAYIVMCVMTPIVPEKRLWAVSAVSAVAHNMGQLVVCIAIVKTPGVIIYAPILIVSGIITGVFTGFGAMYLVRAVRKLKL